MSKPETNQVDQENLLFAVPKKGRLHERIIKLLEGAGLDYNRVMFCAMCGWFTL